MAFNLMYNDHFPLRLINFAKIYMENGGAVRLGNRIAAQLSKLEVLNYFFPSLFVKEMPDSAEEAEYDYETCFILAPRKQGVLSNQGSYKQKINNLEDCLLGNSRNEKTYKNHTAAQNMLRRAASDLVSDEELFADTAANLKNIYEVQLSDEQQNRLSEWLIRLCARLREDETILICTAERTDGFSFERQIYDDLRARASSLCDSGDYAGCWVWLCLGSLFGNYTGQLLRKYPADFIPEPVRDSQRNTCTLIPSPAVIARPFFCGRDEYLRKIDQMFTDGNRVVFLYGIGGIGKTEIVRHYAAECRRRFDTVVYATYAGSLMDLVITDFPFETDPPVQRLLQNGVMESDESYFFRKLSVIRKAAGPRTLFIIDNYDTEYDTCLNEFINGRYHILFTTRFDYSRDYPSLKVGEITDMDSLKEIFMSHYRGYAVEKDDPDLENLIRYVSRHTFTIILLAHHMENSGQTASEMLEALNRNGIESLNEKTGIIRGSDDKAYMNLIRLFGIFDFSEEEKRVLQLLALLPLNGIPAMVFTKWAQLPSTSVLLNLENRGWISRNPGGIALHPVIARVVALALPVHTEQIRFFLDQAAEALANENSWHYTKAQKEQYVLIARSIISSLNTIDENTVRFYQSASVLLGYSGYPAESISLSRQLYDYRYETDGPYAFETARAAYRIGWTYLFNPHLENRLDHAEEWLLKGREIFEKTELNTADQKAMYCGLLENLSKAYSFRYEQTARKEYLDQAEEYANQAVSLSGTWLSDYRQTKKSPAGSLLRLADVYITRGSYEKAEQLIDEAYGILSSIYSDKDPDVLRATSRKAKVLYHLGRYNESLAVTEKNLAAYQEFYGDDNPSCFDQMVLKIQNCIALGHIETAKQIKKEAERTGRKLYTPGSAKLQYLKNLI